MLDIGFGEDVEYINYDGQIHIVARFVLHTQTSWCLVKDNSIILGNGDFYLPKDNFEIIENFNGNKFGNSRFDVKSQEINEYIKNTQIIINNINANGLGDVTIFMENDYRLEVFVDVAGREESWRFFRMDDNSKHFVVF